MFGKTHCNILPTQIHRQTLKVQHVPLLKNSTQILRIVALFEVYRIEAGVGGMVGVGEYLGRGGGREGGL